MYTDSWHGLYRKGWSKRLRPASFAHPAKVSYGLSVRIYEHAIEEGWIEPGQVVLDPFAGIGGFALEAMRHGLQFVGVELEQRFCDMGQGCDCTGVSKEDWVRFQGRWDRMRYEGGRHWCPECIMKAGAVADEREFKPLPLPGTKWAALAKTYQPALFGAAPMLSYVRNSGKIPCTGPHHYRGNIETWERQGMAGSAVIVQGDSRRLGEVLERASLCLSSPPYSCRTVHGGSGLKQHPDNIKGQADYGQSSGQLAALPKGDHAESCERLTCAISSPPYAGMRQDGGGEYAKAGIGGIRPYTDEPIDTWFTQRDQQNLGNLPDTGFEAALAISSPAWMGSGVGGSSNVVNANTQCVSRNRPENIGRDETARGLTYGSEPGQLAQMPEGNLALAISSPPFLESLGAKEGGGGCLNPENKEKYQNTGMANWKWGQSDYGTAAGQLAALPEGDHAEACRPTCAISSPPYIGTPVSAQGADGKSQEWNKAYREYQRTGDHAKFQAQMTKKCDKAGYGGEQGQLAQMPPGDHAAALEAGTETGRAQACISSPPWDKSLTSEDEDFLHRKFPNGNQALDAAAGYGSSDGQLGQQQGSTFWAASRQILEQVYQVLAPGGHAIWVVKAFVRNKAIVDFPGQWRRLCESVGFRTLHEHHAMLTENRGAQHTLDGGLDVRQVKRAGFFRRLYESKYPHLAINHEIVLCFVKEV